jgi:choice-of-anchor B domain-containing protein
MNKLLSATFLISVAVLAGSCTNNNGPAPSDESTCVDGVAADKYPCQNVELLAHVPASELMGERLNDIWGWTDPQTGKEYALVGLTDGVTFVDISDPENPEVIGKLAETGGTASKSVTAASRPPAGFRMRHEKSDWRDFKVYEDHIFVVSDNQPDGIEHGMQVFDLTRLREMETPAEVYTADVVYTEFHDAHNIAINEETGYAYAIGSRSHGPGLHMIDIRDPMNPTFAGYYADPEAGGYLAEGYIHDTQCVIYRGPDEDYQGDEVCFSSSELKFLLVNVTDKAAPYTISQKSYEGNAYAHQGWLTEDHQYFLLDDEMDEMSGNTNTRTYICDVRDLDDPQMIGVYTSEKTSIDHNQFVKGNYTYQANYTSGLRILDISDIASGTLEEVAYFDTYPQDDRPVFEGAWSNYPYFESGVVVVSDITGGLFVLRPELD